MSVLSGFLKFKRHVLKEDGYHLVSEWTNANTVEMDNGNTLEEEIAELKDGVSTGIELTVAEYEALGDEKLTNDVTYYVVDDEYGDGSMGCNVVDNLLSTSTDLPLSANQGRVLNEKIETILNMRYNEETDTVQIYYNGEWVDWKAGGMKELDLLGLAITDWTTANLTSFTLNPLKMIRSNPQSGAQTYASITTNNAYDLDAYKYLNISGMVTFDGYYDTMTNGIYIECVGENSGEVTRIFSKNYNATGSFAFTQRIELPSFAEKQYVKFGNMFYGNSTCITQIDNAIFTKS